MRKSMALFLMLVTASFVSAQEKVGDKWVDNNLTFQVVKQSIKKDGILTLCIADTTRDACIENLQTGFELKVFDGDGNMLWEGIGSGRTRQVKLPKALPSASYITIVAFKPFVTNKRTGTRIHQEKPIRTKYTL